MKKKEPAEPAAVLSIPAMKLAVFELVLKGVSPLVTHKFSAQSQKAIEDKQQQKPGMKKAAKDPDAEFRGGMHEVPGRPGVYGFPASGFKKAAVAACQYTEDLQRRSGYVRGAFHVLGDIVPIVDKNNRPVVPVVNTANVRVGGMTKVADVRYRPEFRGWYVKLRIRYNESAISPAQIANLYNLGKALDEGKSTTTPIARAADATPIGQLP